ncbi:MAG TPA: type II toxin-antitoxin system VapC family toxin [Gaiellaceae bacterium]|nr:type II toxin-antitoxin system VapC family toxin [Gaiellaceae bacterium]
MIVLDASAGVDFLLRRGPRGDWAAAWIRRMEVVHAPHLVDLELISVVRKLVLVGEVSARRAREALDDFAELMIVRYAAAPFITRVWELRHVMTPYDATYVALAEALGIPLLTTDERLARASGHRAEIVAYGA